MDCNFINEEDTLLGVIAGLLLLDKENNQIVVFSDNSKLKDLNSNQVVMQTKQGDYKITVEKYNS